MSHIEYVFITLTTPTADAHRASAQFKSEIPGRGQEVKKDAEKYGAQAGAKVDSTVSNSSSFVSHRYFYLSAVDRLTVAHSTDKQDAS